MSEIPESVVTTWLAARRVIGAFLREFIPDQDLDWYDKNAAALMARLAQHEPPLLINSFDELKYNLTPKCVESMKEMLAHRCPIRDSLHTSILAQYVNDFGTTLYEEMGTDFPIDT